VALCCLPGDSYQGSFHNDTPCGEGTSLYTNGNRYSGSFKDGMPEGVGTMTYAPTEDGGCEVFWTGTWTRGKRVLGSERPTTERAPSPDGE